MAQRSNVFVSYSHRDKPWLDRLCVHLRPLEKPPHRIVIWSDRNIRPGSRWKEELQGALESTRVAILLVSADFLSSDFITENELPPLLEASEREGAVIIPVILKPCRFLRTENLSRYRAINDPQTQPLSRLSEADQEEMFDKISEEIEKIMGWSAAPRFGPEIQTSDRRPVPPTDRIENFARENRISRRIATPDSSSTLNPKYVFATFVAGPNNHFAFALAKAVAEDHNYNPLFLFGAFGLGKTHLLQAIGHEIKRRKPRLKVLYSSAEQFVNELMDATRLDRVEVFQDCYRNVDVLMIDDVQFLASNDRAQEEFLYTFENLYSSKKKIILASDSPPGAMRSLDERLRSRFEGGILAEITPPSLETKIAILQSKAAAENMTLPLNVSEYIGSKAGSNIRELEGLLNRVLAFSSLKEQPITLAFARETLQDILPLGDKPSPPDILKLVAKYFDLRISELKGKSNAPQVVIPRQAAMYLCKKFTDLSYPEIGKLLGDRHPSTVIHSVEKVEQLRTLDQDFKLTLQSLESYFL